MGMSSGSRLSAVLVSSNHRCIIDQAEPFNILPQLKYIDYRSILITLTVLRCFSSQSQRTRVLAERTGVSDVREPDRHTTSFNLQVRFALNAAKVKGCPSANTEFFHSVSCSVSSHDTECTICTVRVLFLLPFNNIS